MPRRAAAVRREVMPDAVYNNRLVTQLINKVLLDGKKATAERIVYGAFDIVAEKTGEDALTVFKKAMDNIRQHLRLSLSVLVALLTRSQWRSTPVVQLLLLSAGWSLSAVAVKRRPWQSVLQTRSSTQLTA